ETIRLGRDQSAARPIRGTRAAAGNVCGNDRIVSSLFALDRDCNGQLPGVRLLGRLPFFMDWRCRRGMLRVLDRTTLRSQVRKLARAQIPEVGANYRMD